MSQSTAREELLRKTWEFFLEHGEGEAVSNAFDALLEEDSALVEVLIRLFDSEADADNREFLAMFITGIRPQHAARDYLRGLGWSEAEIDGLE